MADHALAEAKEHDGNTLVFHTLDDNPADAERLKLEADLYEAVRNGEFALHFQPVTKIRTGAVVGIEAIFKSLGLSRAVVFVRQANYEFQGRLGLSAGVEPMR